jgi:hypothetical protein
MTVQPYDQNAEDPFTAAGFAVVDLNDEDEPFDDANEDLGFSDEEGPSLLEELFARIELMQNVSALSFLQKLTLVGLQETINSMDFQTAADREQMIHDVLDSIASAFAQIGVSYELWEMAWDQTIETLSQEDLAPGASITDLIQEA